MKSTGQQPFYFSEQEQAGIVGIFLAQLAEELHPFGQSHGPEYFGQSRGPECFYIGAECSDDTYTEVVNETDISTFCDQVSDAVSDASDTEVANEANILADFSTDLGSNIGLDIKNSASISQPIVAEVSQHDRAGTAVLGSRPLCAERLPELPEAERDRGTRPGMGSSPSCAAPATLQSVLCLSPSGSSSSAPAVGELPTHQGIAEARGAALAVMRGRFLEYVPAMLAEAGLQWEVAEVWWDQLESQMAMPE